MKSPDYRRSMLMATAFVVTLIWSSGVARAASWNGIEPFKSRRADVIKILGEPIAESPEGVLRFPVMGGSVQVSFVAQKFVVTKKLQPELEGTVLQIVLQHDRSSETPESMKLLQNRAFSRDDSQASTIFRNMKEGIIYTFFQGTLRSTRYSFSDGQLSKARR
ncbi:MAG: hypothetical protein ACXW18_05475 [Pyrinomonadaceae bacterium]